jgi:(E)-4-hydroxy-3-methylbut-2-enyl-diphosphate synthase
MQRRKTRAVNVGPVTIGGNAPVSIQSMTKTHTEDVSATVQQIHELADIGCQIIRCAVPNHRVVRALEKVVEQSPLPVVADIHFDPDLALASINAGADGIRVNPCTISDKKALEEFFREAAHGGVKVRIGINSGSVRPRRGMEVEEDAHAIGMAELMVREAMDACKLAEGVGCRNLVISLKASDVPTTLLAYRKAAKLCDYPFHLGVTAAGLPSDSIVKSSVGIGALLSEGIGDTIRVSMTGRPHNEVHVAKQILEALELRCPKGVQIISCPTCGRCNIDLRRLVEDVAGKLRDCECDLKIAVMGCVVNGPGEAAEADLGVAGGKEFGFLFKKGRRIARLDSDELADGLVAEVKKIIEERDEA